MTTSSACVTISTSTVGIITPIRRAEGCDLLRALALCGDPHEDRHHQRVDADVHRADSAAEQELP